MTAVTMALTPSCILVAEPLIAGVRYFPVACVYYYSVLRVRYCPVLLEDAVRRSDRGNGAMDAEENTFGAYLAIDQCSA